jgi:phosphatidylserine decarboxylase
MDHYIFSGIVLALLTALPLAWKWKLSVFRAGWTVAILGVVSAALVNTAGHSFVLSNWERAGLVWLLAIGMTAALLLYRFYRDPDRHPPGRTDVLVSPADGKVIYIRHSENGIVPISTKNGRTFKLFELTRTPLRAENAIIVGIAMTLLDVHVIRMPCAGRVTSCKHFSGLFGSLRHPEMILENERATTVVDKGEFQVAIVQIASRLVRQIAMYVKEGQEVSIGQRMGVIRLGSQVDLIIPERPGLKILVKPGDRLRSGESIVALLE